jgi:hypothetical protein
LNVPDIVGGQWCGRCLVCLNIGVGGGEGIGRDNVGKSNTANWSSRPFLHLTSVHMLFGISGARLMQKF